jgi:ABC-type nitrate/sulfonate/bicarbonate transport system permease component
MFAMLYIAGITFINIPDDNTRVVDTVLGFILGTVIATILAFFYGTSASSMKKTEMMSNK